MANGVPQLSTTISYFNTAAEEILATLKTKTPSANQDGVLRDSAEETVSLILIEAQNKFRAARSYSTAVHDEMVALFTPHGVSIETAEKLIESDVVGYH